MQTKYPVVSPVKLVSLFSAFVFVLPVSGQVVPELAQPMERELPQLVERGLARQLVVDGEPYLMLAGELHNSSSSSRAYMTEIWPRLAALNLNTVLAVVSWDMVEPQEGTFDFSLVDGLIEDARAHDIRLILLWFGSWKNGLSHYVPSWVKNSFERFPRVQVTNGTLEILSTFGVESLEADKRAFAALMRHLREVDSVERTVIMVQVQNEVGLHADSRDRSFLANEAFSSEVPGVLMDYLDENRQKLLPHTRQLWANSEFRTAGTWEEVFGQSPQTDEFFMAWHYARYINAIAEAGKAEYALPMFVNAWIVQPQDIKPGDYPSGGPQAHVLDAWWAGAPAIDIFAPDIYLPNFTEICRAYTQRGNTLFVPESRAGLKGAANAFVAFGQFNAIGYSPFGIDSRMEADPETDPIGRAYGVLRQLAPIILNNQGLGGIAGVSLDTDNPMEEVRLGNYVLTVRLRNEFDRGTPPELGYAILLHAGNNEFYVAGQGVQVTFAADSAGPRIVGLDLVEEGQFEDGIWIPDRRLNGDAIMLDYDMESMAALGQTGTGLKLSRDQPEIQRVILYRFQ